MPSFVSKRFNTYFKNILGIDQSTNAGVDAATRVVQDGAGKNTVISLSDDQLLVKPNTDNSATAFDVNNVGGDSILSVDTTNKVVKLGDSAVNGLTLFKEMGLYDFSPSTAGYHFPLIANTMFVPTGATAFAADEDWGNGTDPATTLDVSGLTNIHQPIACFWYLENNITLDSVRYMANADNSVTLNFHLYAYDLDVSSNHGDLSGGAVHANASVSATSGTVKTGTFTLDTADINAGKVVIGFAENVESTVDMSCAFTIKYHIR